MQNGSTIACKVNEHELCTNEKCKCPCHSPIDSTLPDARYLIWELGVELTHLRGQVDRDTMLRLAANALAKHPELSAFLELAPCMVGAVEALDWGPDETSWYWSYSEYLEHLNRLLPQASVDKLILAPFATGLERL